MQKISILIIASILAEIAVFIVIGNWIGLIPTLLFVVASAFFGIYVLKNIGVQSMKAIQNSIDMGQPPGIPMIHSFLSFVGGLLLIVPGFITSVFGILCIIPFTKKLFLPTIFYWLRKKMKHNQVIIYRK